MILVRSYITMSFMSAAAAVLLRSRASSTSATTSRNFSRASPNSTAAFSAARRSFSPYISRLLIRAMADSAASSSPFKKIQIQRDDITFDAYVVGKEDAPGIVVVQEWWGVDFEIKNQAVKISQLGDGFKALIPDLYRGKVCLEVAEAQHTMDGLDWQEAVKDIRAAVDWLKANGSKKAGVTGFCMGGALAIASSVLIPEVDAVVGFYGIPSSELADPAQAKAPVQAHFGEIDNYVGFSDVTAAKSLEGKLKAAGVPYEIHIYPGNGHAFMNRSPEGVKRRKRMGMNDEDEAAAQLAWSRFKSWMTRYLSA